MGSVTHVGGNVALVVWNVTHAMGNVTLVVWNVTYAVGNVAIVVGNITYAVGNVTIVVRSGTIIVGNGYSALSTSTGFSLRMRRAGAGSGRSVAAWHTVRRSQLSLSRLWSGHREK